MHEDLSPDSPAEPRLKVPQTATSHDGYEFSPASDRWKLNKDTTFLLEFLDDVDPETALGFRLALTRYAEENSASHALNMRERFAEFIDDTDASAVTGPALINWRSQLDRNNEWKLGGLKGFLLSWQGWGFPGVSKDVVALLQGWRLKGNEKGKPVARGDEEEGPYTDIELQAILDWAHAAASREEIDLETYAILLTALMTARRPIQIAALRGADLTISDDANSKPRYVIRFPRAKQRGSGFRQRFRELPVIEDLYLTLRALHKTSVTRVERALRCPVPADLAQQIPIFIHPKVADKIRDVAALRDIVLSDAPDRLHSTTGRLKYRLRVCQKRCTAKSERTGEPIRIFATRFRYTRGTNMRRQGYGPEQIAEALDHSDTQQMDVYTENTAQEGAIIERIIGPKLAPFAQACMGTLVRSERDAIRGNDPRSRVPNHNQQAVGTCGHYGFCASGHLVCYTCVHFQPWEDGPHEDVLQELYEEKQRAIDAGCSPEVINANDRLILAVEDCAAQYREAEAARQRLAQAPDSAREARFHG